MAWVSNSIKNSLYGFLGLDSARVDDGRLQQLETIRSAMLDCLQQVTSQEVPALQRRMARAEDPQTLWYLRADLMGVLASGEGESAARAQLDHITKMFQGLLPKGLMSRTNRLRG